METRSIPAHQVTFSPSSPYENITIQCKIHIEKMEEKEVAAEQQVTAPVDDVTRQQSEQLKAQWEQYAQAFSKSLPTSSPYFSGGIPFPLLPNVSVNYLGCFVFSPSKRFVSAED